MKYKALTRYLEITYITSDHMERRQTRNCAVTSNSNSKLNNTRVLVAKTTCLSWSSGGGVDRFP